MTQWQKMEGTRRQVAIAGRVTDRQTGQAIAGADVSVKNADQKLVANSRTAADGHYHVMDLADGEYTLEASVPAAGSRYGTAQGQATVERDTEHRIKMAVTDFDLPPTRIHGRVTDHDTHQPIAGASVRLRGDTQIMLTDADGRYALDGLVKGNPTVEVSASKYTMTWQDTSLTAGQDQTVDVELSPT